MSITFRHRNVNIAGSSIHVVEAGNQERDAYVLVHGWPESWSTWENLIEVAAPNAHFFAIDLPGIGDSGPADTGGSKVQIATLVHHLIEQLGLEDVTLVGHDAGGMVAYAFLRHFDDVRRVVIVITVIPGVDPWDEVIANPYIWHFGFHAIPGLPELLVQDHRRDYFDYFYDILSVDPARITDAARTAHSAAYASASALSAGFDLYRAFSSDVAENGAFATGSSPKTPLLYIRGSGSPGDIETYADGFRAAGVADLAVTTVPDAGHFLQEETPRALWDVIRAA